MNVPTSNKARRSWTLPKPGLQVALVFAALFLIAASAGAYHVRSQAEQEQAAAASLAVQAERQQGSQDTPSIQQEEVQQEQSEQREPLQEKKEEYSDTPSLSLAAENKSSSGSEELSSVPTYETKQEPVQRDDPQAPTVSPTQPSPKEATKPLEDPAQTEKPKPSMLHVQLTVSAPAATSFSVSVPSGSTIETVMQAGKKQGFLTYTVKAFSGLGAFVESIQGIPNDESAGLYWTYYVNGAFAARGISQQAVHDGDRVLWRYGPSPK